MGVPVSSTPADPLSGEERQIDSARDLRGAMRTVVTAAREDGDEAFKAIGGDIQQRG